jgi:hypothetical protein
MTSDIRLEDTKVIVDGPLYTAADTFVPVTVWQGGDPAPKTDNPLLGIAVFKTELMAAGKELTRLRDAVALVQSKLEELQIQSTITADAPHFTQDGWRWCNRCRILHYAPNRARSVCAADTKTTHSTEGSWEYVLFPHRSRYTPNQGGWAWCNKCQGLYHSVGASKCAAGGEHDHTGSPMYALSYDAAPPGITSQDGWHFCSRCHSLFHADNVGVCPAVGVHTASGSNYFVAHR